MEHVPTAPIELPEDVEPAQSSGGGGGKAAPKARPNNKAKPAPKSRPNRPRKRTDVAPIRINPIARNVNVERGD
jgi:hypothetical protein